MKPETKQKIKKILSAVATCLFSLSWSFLCFFGGVCAGSKSDLVPHSLTASAAVEEIWQFNKTPTPTVGGSDVTYTFTSSSGSSKSFKFYTSSTYMQKTGFKDTDFNLNSVSFCFYNSGFAAVRFYWTKKYGGIWNDFYGTCSFGATFAGTSSPSLDASNYTRGDPWTYVYGGRNLQASPKDSNMRFAPTENGYNVLVLNFDTSAITVKDGVTLNSLLSRYATKVDALPPITEPSPPLPLLPTPSLSYRNGYLYTDFDSTITDQILGVAIVGPDQKTKIVRPGLAIQPWGNGSYYAYLMAKTDSEYADSAHSSPVSVGDVVILPKLDTPTISANGAYISWLPVPNADYYIVYWGENADTMQYSVVTSDTFFTVQESGFYRVAAGSYSGTYDPSELSNALDMTVTTPATGNPAFAWLIGAADSFLGMHIFGNGFTIGSILGLAFGVILLGFAIKIFLGG